MAIPWSWHGPRTDLRQGAKSPAFVADGSLRQNGPARSSWNARLDGSLLPVGIFFGDGPGFSELMYCLMPKSEETMYGWHYLFFNEIVHGLPIIMYLIIL